MIHEYLEYPTKEQWIEIEENSKINSLYLEVKRPEINDLFAMFAEQELASWIRLFNNRLGQSRMSYIFFKHYYNKGIPDEEWYISPGKDGQSIQYFPHFKKDETINYKVMFDYYVDAFYYKFFSAWDTIFHIINVQYQFDVEKDKDFNRNILTNLNSVNLALKKQFNKTNYSKAFKKSRILRNDITHNFAPNDISSGISKKKEDGQLKEISFGVGSYTPSSEFVQNIDEVIEEFIKFLRVFKRGLESSPKKP
ncbi:Cthe_2314 family HEPN domain-containing protein [Paenibacillus taichungensis]